MLSTRGLQAVRGRARGAVAVGQWPGNGPDGRAGGQVGAMAGNVPDTPLRRAMRAYGLTEHEAPRIVVRSL